MTDKITVPHETWDAMREALVSAGNFISPYSIGEQVLEKVDSALTAAASVSHPKPETAPVTEGGAITSESVLALLVKEMRYIATITNGQAHRIAMMTLEKVAAANAVSVEPLKVTDLGRYALEPQAQGEAFGWVRTAEKGPGVYDPLFLKGTKKPVGYVSGYTPVYTHPQATEPAWRPIETAPKDGSEILAFNGENALMHWIEVHSYAAWEYADETLCEICPEADQPTHWMPLPAAPEAKQ